MMKRSRLAMFIAATAAIAVVSTGTATATPQSEPAAVTALDTAELAELTRLSDPATLVDLHDGARRMDRIAEVLTRNGDRRGIFAVFYRSILHDANPLLDAGNFDDPQWARAVSLEFFREYLVNLHGHLTGGAVTPGWQRYYDMAADPSRSPGRVAASALDAHLMVDFPAALAATGTRVENTRDFFAIGDSLINTTGHITDELHAIYGAKLAGFFGLYFVGPVADIALGEGNTSYLMFQSVRGTSLTSGLALQVPATAGAAEVAMYGLYNTAETVFDGLEFANLI
ncbi:DUF5995 family protein [Nocardia sp. NBC_00511]|uniref:DUF5995 family protein n=1 Tax=Nocardia sp. NBC_00511 TaxID=2903591 RepID=UPI0030E1CD10